MSKKEYEEMKKIAKEEGFFFPETHIFHGELANVPHWIRRYHQEKGKNGLK